MPGIKPQVFATTNPDGPGYSWVKRRWSIPDSPIEVIRTKDEKTGRTRIFIPSRVQDNPKLMESDPGYIKYLQSIQDDDLREAWLNGSWAGITLKGLTIVNKFNKREMRNASRLFRMKLCYQCTHGGI